MYYLADGWFARGNEHVVWRPILNLGKETHYPVLHPRLSSTVMLWQLDWSAISPLLTPGFSLPTPPLPPSNSIYLQVWWVFWYAQIIIVPAIRLISPTLLRDPCASHTRYISPVRPTDVHVPLVTRPAEARADPCAVLVPLVYKDAFLSFGSETYELKSEIVRPWRKFWEIKQKVTLERKTMLDALNNRTCKHVTWKTLLEVLLEMMLGQWYVLCNVLRTLTTI